VVAPHCSFVPVLYDCSLVMCNIKVVCVKSLSVFAPMLLCEEIMQSLCTFSLCFFHCLLLSTVLESNTVHFLSQSSLSLKLIFIMLCIYREID